MLRAHEAESNANTNFYYQAEQRWLQGMVVVPTRQRSITPSAVSNRGATWDAESVRAFLHDWLDQQHDEPIDSVVIDEMGIRQGRTRIDVAVINGQLHGYEIKSERDNLRRLRAQATSYSLVFDRMTLVCGEKHLEEALEAIPLWWEVLSVVQADQELFFQCVRPGWNNPGRSARALVECLWLEEAMAFVAQRHSLRGLRGKPRTAVWDSICDLFSLEEIAGAVRDHLKATASYRGHRGRQL